MNNLSSVLGSVNIGAVVNGALWLASQVGGVAHAIAAATGSLAGGASGGASTGT